MGVSKNRGTPEWMVYNGKPLLKWMIWGYPYFRKHRNGIFFPTISEMMGFYSQFLPQTLKIFRFFRDRWTHGLPPLNDEWVKKNIATVFFAVAMAHPYF